MQQWSDFSSLTTARGSAACGLLRNNIVNAAYSYDVVVAGGMQDVEESDDVVALKSVEIFKASENSWTVGPELPMALFGASMVQYTSDQVSSEF